LWWHGLTPYVISLKPFSLTTPANLPLLELTSVYLLLFCVISLGLWVVGSLGVAVILVLVGVGLALSIVVAHIINEMYKESKIISCL
jgi:hypothetical protein